MLWLIWHMWILIALAFLGGVIAGWVIRARSDETPDRPLLEPIDAEVVVPASQAAAPVVEPNPAPASEPEAETDHEAASKSEDDLTQIKGIGPKAAAKLTGEGVTAFAQIASWTQADIERFDALIDGGGRIKRDEWVKQAQALAQGGS